MSGEQEFLMLLTIFGAHCHVDGDNSDIPRNSNHHFDIRLASVYNTILHQRGVLSCLW